MTHPGKTLRTFLHHGLIWLAGTFEFHHMQIFHEISINSKETKKIVTVKLEPFPQNVAYCVRHLSLYCTVHV